MMQSLLLVTTLVFFTIQKSASQMTCGPRMSPRLLQEIPCDMSKSFYCPVPGPGYPWSSVRRYIYENQGLMRRMYGDQRQSYIVRNEIEDLHDKYDFSFYTHQASSDQAHRKSFPRFSPRSAFGSEPDEEVPPSPLPSSTVPPVTTTTKTPEVSSSTSSPSVTPSSSESPIEETASAETTVFSEPAEPVTITANVTAEPIIVPLPMYYGAATEEPEKPEEPPKKGFNACPVKEEVVAPYWANNTRGEILALLNVYPFEQYVHWEKCQFEFNQMYCRDGCRCEQQFRLHRLLAFDPKNECRGIFADWFRFPSSCICVCYDLPGIPTSRKSRL